MMRLPALIVIHTNKMILPANLLRTDPIFVGRLPDLAAQPPDFVRIRTRLIRMLPSFVGMPTDFVRMHPNFLGTRPDLPGMRTVFLETHPNFIHRLARRNALSDHNKPVS